MVGDFGDIFRRLGSARWGLLSLKRTRSYRGYECNYNDHEECGSPFHCAISLRKPIPCRVLLVDELASAGGGRYVTTMNCVMAVGTPVYQRETRSVVVRRMTLQAESGLAQRQQVLVRRTVRRVTFQAVLGDRWMLKREGALKLSVAV